MPSYVRLWMAQSEYLLNLNCKHKKGIIKMSATENPESTMPENEKPTDQNKDIEAK